MSQTLKPLVGRTVEYWTCLRKTGSGLRLTMLTAMRTVPVNKPTPAASWALNFFWLRSNTRFHGSYNEPYQSRFSQSMQCSHLGNSELINAWSLPVLQSFLTNCRGVEWSVENFNMTKKTQRTHNCCLHSTSIYTDCLKK